MLLNCDLGESFGYWKIEADPLVMPHIDMANIACGYHAGDPCVMVKTVALAKTCNVKIGAHPSYPDKQGFGRRSMALSRDEIEAFVIYQLGALVGICQSQGCKMSYVKPHGALYNDMMKDDHVLQGIFAAIKKFDKNLPLLMMATPKNQSFRNLASKHGINVLFEAFADRAYDDQGLLLARTEEGAVLTSSKAIMKQVQQLAQHGTVTSINGRTITLEADTLCVHGDNAQAVEQIIQLKTLLKKP
ncbi:MAG: 5-oxoprolinase subunit PxpA [Pseudomonadales bacterium]|nr:5-oxoprolinase subunit PxpA [Pseudomonadales bacterium]